MSDFKVFSKAFSCILTGSTKYPGVMKSWIWSQNVQQGITPTPNSPLKSTPLFLAKPPPPTPLHPTPSPLVKSANYPSPPFLGNLPPLYCFFVNTPPKNQIFQWTPKILSFSSLTPYLLKVTKFLIKISQFKKYFCL